MIRAYQEHDIRFQQELNGCWDFGVTDINGVQAYTHQLMVPSCLEQYTDFLDYRGAYHYKKQIFLSVKGDYRLIFKGVSHSCKIFFDGKLVGTHYNAFTAFTCNLVNQIVGNHELVVEGTNAFTEDSALHMPNDYYTYGGIIRPVVLEKVPELFLRDVKVRTRLADTLNWNIHGEVDLATMDVGAKNYTIQVLLNNKCIFEQMINGEIDQDSVVFDYLMPRNKVNEWNVNQGNLYLLQTVILNQQGVAIDDLFIRFGYREITLDNSNVVINGRSVEIKGFNRHEDHGIVGASIPPQLMMNDLDLMVSTHANAVRTSHYPNDERFLDICDEKGILVWEESHARGLNLIKMQNLNFEIQSETSINEMIDQHYNHPSIIIWGLLNECASDEKAGRVIYKKEINLIRALDASRPVSFASNKGFSDLCFDLVDIVSLNIYSGWYDNNDVQAHYQKLLTYATEHGGQGKPVIISEFGAGAIYGFRSPIKQPWSEEAQCDVLADNLAVYLNEPSIAGVFIWQFADCRVTKEGNWFLSRPKTENNKGIFDEYRRQKLAYKTVKQYYKNT